MDKAYLDIINNIFVDILMATDRKTSSSWYFKDEKLYYDNFMIIYDGEGSFTRNGITQKVKKGDFIYFCKGDQRELTTNHDNLLCTYAVNFSYLAPNDKSIKALPLDFVTKITDDDIFLRLCTLFKRLCSVYLSNPDLSYVKCRYIFSEILYLLFLTYCPEQTNYSNKKKVEEIITFMTENYSKYITLNDLAKIHNISISYLGKIFKSTTNMTPIEYLIQIRLTEAKKLLLDGCSVAETACLTGFFDQYHFSKTFKLKENISPKQYKKMF